MPVIALDTETTGLDIRHGCSPFFISTWSLSQKELRGNFPFFAGINDPAALPGVNINYHFPVDPTTATVLPPTTAQRNELTELLTGNEIVMHNAAFDLRSLASIGIYLEVSGWRPKRLPTSPSQSTVIPIAALHDTSLAAHVNNSKFPAYHGLKACAAHYLWLSDDDETELTEAVARLTHRATELGYALGHDPTGERQTAYDYWFLLDPTLADQSVVDVHDYANPLVRYAALDAYRTILLHHYLQETLTTSGRLDHYHRQLKYLPYFFRMEEVGLSLRPERFRALRASLRNKAAHLQHQFEKITTELVGEPVNPRSAPQLCSLFYDTLKLKPVKYSEKTGEPSNDAASLKTQLHNLTDPKQYRFLPEKNRKLAKQLIDCLVSYGIDDGFLEQNVGYRTYKTASQYLTSYLDYALPGQYSTQTLFPYFNQKGTATTRSSSENPNGQNVSTRAEAPLRSAFGPGPGRIWVAIDYSQLELRLFARAANDKRMLDALNSGGDFHSYVGCRMYGCEPHGLTKHQRRNAKGVNFGRLYGLGVSRLIALTGLPNIDRIMSDIFPDSARFMHQLTKQIDRDGYIETLFGYPLQVAPDPSYKGINYLIQGTAGDLVKQAMVATADYLASPDCPLPERGHLIANIHDELIFDLPLTDEGTIATVVETIAALMAGVGKEIDCLTPVDPNIIPVSWGSPIPFHDWRSTALAA